MFKQDWSTSDLILANSTCFYAPMMEKIYEKSLTCRKGTWFITLSKKIPHADKISTETQN